jgi:4-amino-4-deoxy-L-arabinose transferase-like glycosyltransferase
VNLTALRGVRTFPPAVWVALTSIMLLTCVLAAGCWRVYSNTWDEPEHLAAGVELLDRGSYEYDTEHPPLGRVVLALGPWLAGAHSFGTPPPEGTPEGVDILYTGGHYWQYLTLARLDMLPFLALLLFTTWLWARRLFRSHGAALLAPLLLATVPPVLGNGALASLDVPAAATILLALYALQHWLVTARLRDALFFGLAAGVAIGTKFSGIPFIGLALVALALARAALTRTALPTAGAGPLRAAGDRGARWQTWLAGLAIAALAVLIPVWLAYAPRAPNAARVAMRFNWAVSYLLAQGGVDHAFGTLLSHLWWLPRELKDLVNGIVAVKAHNDTGHLAYLLGELRRDGWWYFYLVALAVKTPIPMLVGGPVGLALLAGDGWRRRDAWMLAPLVLVLTLLTFASTFSRINIGVRHILIVYPFFALGGAWVVVRAWRRIAALRERRAILAAHSAAAALCLAVVWQLSTLWRAYPDYLPYFNEAIAHPERVLVDSDLDWGQDLYRLERRCAELRIRHLSLAYRGTALLSREPLPPLMVLPGRRPTHGWVAVSQLARTRNPIDYAWLNPYQPVERIGKTIDLYYIP